RAPRLARGGQHRPALRDGVDLAFLVVRRAERCAVVEVSAPVPFAVPAVALDALAQLRRLALTAFGEQCIALRASERGELHQHVVKEEAEPDALAFALRADEIHAVVPVAGAD